MKKSLILLPVLFLLFACSKNIYHSEFDFANNLAKQGLWKEANFRWQKCLERGEKNASLYNNIAIFFEKSGDFEKAEAAYQKALQMAPGNKFIKSNYDKLKAYLEHKTEGKQKKKEAEKNEI